MVWVIGWDWLLWQTLPNNCTWTDAGIIVATGPYLLRRERIRKAYRSVPLNRL